MFDTAAKVIFLQRPLSTQSIAFLRKTLRSLRPLRLMFAVFFFVSKFIILHIHMEVMA